MPVPARAICGQNAGTALLAGMKRKSSAGSPVTASITVSQERLRCSGKIGLQVIWCSDRMPRRFREI
jgi:hypothetical protein